MVMSKNIVKIDDKIYLEKEFVERMVYIALFIGKEFKIKEVMSAFSNSINAMVKEESDHERGD